MTADTDTSSAAPADRLSRAQLLALAAVSAVVTANAYYIHPIIARVAEAFDVSDAMIGAVPALNQIALALGIFLLLPLGDRISNRKLVSIFVAAQCAAIAVMAFSDSFILFVAGSTLLGFFTIAPYLLPAYVSKRVDPAELGRATAVLTTGIIAGILVARAGAGLVGEHLGWRAVYYIAAGLMLAVTVAAPLVMEERERAGGQDASSGGYPRLILSIPPIIGRHPEILLSGAIQGLSFGVFLAVWLALGLHLTSPEMGYGVDVVGYLAIFAIINLLSTPRLGVWADKVGPRRARLAVAAVNLTGVALLGFVGHSLWLLMIPIIIMNIAGPTIDVTGRMTFLKEPAEIRTRLMTVYIVMMFIGGGLASWAGTAAYDWGGWTGSAVLALCLSSLVFTLSLAAWLIKRGEDRPAV
ncbi:MAG: MFS transporter [Pseudomonadota bacterium]